MPVRKAQSCIDAYTFSVHEDVHACIPGLVAYPNKASTHEHVIDGGVKPKSNWRPDD
jgi:hypothetical protein